MKRLTAFTLIELLIVVAIIAILAAIAIPNFLEAQTRSKVSRVKSDLRTMTIALDSYCVDHNIYPYGTLGDLAANLDALTTPVAYLSSAKWKDPFQAEDKLTANTKGEYLYYYYKNPNMYDQNAATSNPGQGGFILQCKQAWGSVGKAPKAYCINSFGPDRLHHAICLVPPFVAAGNPINDLYVYSRYYDPSNGTISKGDIGRFGGSVPGNVPPGK